MRRVLIIIIQGREDGVLDIKDSKGYEKWLDA